MTERPNHKGTTKGFSRLSKLTQGRIREATESRGFAESRVLTHWAEIAGAGIAAISRPVEVSYGRGGMGATLTLLTTGAQATMLEMQKEALRAKVNACYGYNAIARIRITQTAATGFSDGKVEFAHAPKQASTPVDDPEIRREAGKIADGAQNEDLRVALERLATNFLTKPK